MKNYNAKCLTMINEYCKLDIEIDSCIIFLGIKNNTEQSAGRK